VPPKKKKKANKKGQERQIMADNLFHINTKRKEE
jgi:hypothetical protein